MTSTPQGRARPQSFFSERRTTSSVSLTVNGAVFVVAFEDPRVTLLDLLRKRLHKVGTKEGCDRGQCGACTVLLNGRRTDACLVLAITRDGASVTTIECLVDGDLLYP